MTIYGPDPILTTAVANPANAAKMASRFEYVNLRLQIAQEIPRGSRGSGRRPEAVPTATLSGSGM